MIQVLGVRHNIALEIREQLSIITKRIDSSLKKLKQICDEVVIISTCNRTEIYFKSNGSGMHVIEQIFEKLNWNSKFIPCTFYYKEDEAIEHLMNVACGFDSIIFGEEQILGQVRMAYDQAVKAKSVKSEFRRLLDTAITCGKEFRQKTRLYKIPVSSASIVVDEARKRDIKKLMILGYGGVGALVEKYIKGMKFEKLYIATREKSEDTISNDPRVEFIKFKDRKDYYGRVECIISTTSAPHTVIESRDVIGHKLLIFDLAVPRDVDGDVYDLEGIEVYNIDNINTIDDQNHGKRKTKMLENRYIIRDYMDDFKDWRKIREITPEIIKLKSKGEAVSRKRYEVFKNKNHTKDPEQLAETLIQSTSNAYINKAIEVLKEEYLKGRGDECLKIIEKIFY